MKGVEMVACIQLPDGTFKAKEKEGFGGVMWDENGITAVKGEGKSTLTYHAAGDFSYLEKADGSPNAYAIADINVEEAGGKQKTILLMKQIVEEMVGARGIHSLSGETIQTTDGEWSGRTVTVTVYKEAMMVHCHCDCGCLGDKGKSFICTRKEGIFDGADYVLEHVSKIPCSVFRGRDQGAEEVKGIVLKSY